MKNVKKWITATAFVFAIGGAFASGILSSNDVYRESDTGGPCTPSVLPEPCAPDGEVICTVEGISYYKDSDCMDPYFFEESN